MAENKDLIPIADFNPPSAFVAGGLQQVLDMIEAHARSVVADTSTAAGRKAIIGAAYQVARSKTWIDERGKEYVATLKEMPRIVDAERKRARDFLDSLAAEVRRPVTEIEEREAADKQRQADVIARIRGMLEHPMNSAAAIKDRIAYAKAVDVSDDFGARRDEAMELRASVIAQLQERHEAAVQAEAQAAELERLRAIEAEQRAEIERQRAAEAQREREEQIRREAEERARLKAEAAAREQIHAAERRERAAREAQEEAERKEKAAAEAAARLERERAEAADRARKEHEAEAERASASQQHVANCLREVHAALTSVIDGLPATSTPSDIARAVVLAIHRGQVARVRISC